MKHTKIIIKKIKKIAVTSPYSCFIGSRQYGPALAAGMFPPEFDQLADRCVAAETKKATEDARQAAKVAKEAAATKAKVEAVEKRMVGK